MPVSESNACLGVRLIGILEWERSAIVTAGTVGKMNRGKDAAALESYPLLPQLIRVITYRSWQSIFFIKVRKFFIFYNFRKQNTCVEADDRRTLESGLI